MGSLVALGPRDSAPSFCRDNYESVRGPGAAVGGAQHLVFSWSGAPRFWCAQAAGKPVTQGKTGLMLSTDGAASQPCELDRLRKMAEPPFPRLSTGKPVILQSQISGECSMIGYL